MAHNGLRDSLSRIPALLALLCLVLAAEVAQAAQPVIAYVQLFNSGGTRYILLHFDLEANRDYDLEYINYFPTNGATWSVLQHFPREAGPSHYVWPDPINPSVSMRFYRLKASP